MNIIYFGNNKDLGTYTDADMKSCTGTMAVAMDIDQLSIDQLEFTVRSGGGNALYQYSNLKNVPYGTPVWWYKDDTLIGKFFFESIARVGKIDYEIVAVSHVGLLSRQKHYGGLYAGATFASVAADIIGNSIVYSTESNVASVPVYGWLPVASKRDNLHQLLFAVGANIKKDSNGNPVFYFETSTTIKTVVDASVFIGGKISYNTPATAVEVTEHTFAKTSTDEELVLYDNTEEIVSEGNTTVTWDDPVYGLTSTGTIVIVSQGVNFAVIRGQGTLTGKKYTHQTKITTARNTDDTNAAENVYTVADATLVSLVNGANVAKRILNYVTKATTVQTEIKLTNEKPGDLVLITDPYGESITAFIANMEITASTFLKAECMLIRGYFPTGQGNNYSRSVLLTGSGTWTVPDGVDSITLTLISGGQGGQGGYNGTDGTRGVSYGTYRTAGAGGNGGSCGIGGNGGRVYQEVVSVQPGQIYAYRCGNGGAGGAIGGSYGIDGEETTFGAKTTENAAALVDAIQDMFTGYYYGGSGKLGINGAAGGSGGSYKDGKSGNDVVSGSDTYKGGSGGKGGGGTSSTGLHEAGGGGGGGAALGEDGASGTDGSVSRSGSVGSYTYRVFGGSGGNGANARIAIPAVQYGSGGNGGNGGGGGGGTGGMFKYGTSDTVYLNVGNPGLGGSGSAGSDGMPGCILIYY